ncbi:pectinesterase family protein [Flavobacterium sp. XS2P39]|uniref:pectinesterase family protein n=1 Tax=Flavobacterium sp. XS2P39 TaxID=3401725 RepID=UPI003AAC5F48
MKLKLKILYMGIFSLVSFYCLAKSSNETRKEGTKRYDILVDAKGSGDYRSVQEAIDAVAVLNEKETVIFIKNGIYKEKLVLPQNKINITLIGENKNKTILTYGDYASKKNEKGQNIGTSGSYSFAINGANFRAENITFENSAGPVGQAVAVRIDGDKVIFKNCKFLGFQDTLYSHGNRSRQYYKNCYIEGTTDFIFGAATAVFDNCEIFAKAGGTYITAANTPQANSYGFVFLNCKLTSNSASNSFYLGRPWENYAQTVFIQSKIGNHIKAAGWHNWGRKEAEGTAFYAEYKCRGAGFRPKERVSWSHQLKKAGAAKYTVETILGADFSKIIKENL